MVGWQGPPTTLEHHLETGLRLPFCASFLFQFPAPVPSGLSSVAESRSQFPARGFLSQAPCPIPSLLPVSKPHLSVSFP